MIKNHGCPEHEELMKNRNTDKWKSNYKENKRLTRTKCEFNVKICARTNEFVKYDSFND